ncbi:AAA family ATPase [Bradyrhizobium sp. TM239]|uniref:AAA family ATPase n=1 Tax=Bradyrhizobium sp. TM239 TaxID=2599802 RepID=UPI0027D5FC09|nr:hypothetical protein TM239_41190 [Bradyrhizobium sp. TM239]
MISLDEISIQAFRGIPDKVTLDLSAPITLIYAPNGVGKTSLCDAAEFLLLDQIKRLDNSGAGRADYRCTHANDETETQVSGKIRVENQSILLTRTLTRCKWKVGSAAEVAVTLSDLLQCVAPSGSEPNVHKNHANASRQIWLRGARFLSSDSLASLLDSSEEAVEARQRLFADLLGVGHLLEAERQLENYQKTLRPLVRERQALLEAAQGELRDRQQKVSEEREEDHLAFLPAANSRLREAGNMLGFSKRFLDSEASDAAELKRRVALLRSDLAARKASFELRRQAEIRMAPDWKSRYLLAQQLDAEQAKLASEADLEAELKNQIEATAATIQQVEQEGKAVREQANAARAIVEELSSSLASCIPSLGHFLATTGREALTAEEAVSLCSSVSSETARSARVALLLSIQSQLSERASERVESENLRQQLIILGPTLASSDDITRLIQESASAEQQVNSLRQKYDDVAGPADQLKQLVAQVSSLLEHAQNCPACGHDWQSPERLKRALEDAQRAMPRGLQALAEQLTAAQHTFGRLSNELHAKRQALHIARELGFRQHTLSEKRASFESLLSEAQLRESANLAQDVFAELKRLELIGNLFRLVTAISVAEQFLERSIDREVKLEQYVNSIQEHVRAVESERLLSLEALRQRFIESRSVLEKVQRALAGAELESEATRKRIESIASRLQQLRSAWLILADSEEWTDEKLAMLSGQLSKEREIIAASEALLDQAEQLADVSANMEEITRLQAKVRPLQNERDRLDLYMQSAAASQDAYRAARVEHANRQMDQLVRVVSPMFNRLQSNEVYEGIRVGDASAPLSWRAVSERLVMDPDTKFSQGQKQDFALSVFLARARGLGGSFFLDEPLVHLDDLNRVALLDVLRAIVLEENRNLSLVITTANRPVLRHMLEKFALVASANRSERAIPIMRVIELEGNPRVGISVKTKGFG